MITPEVEYIPCIKFIHFYLECHSNLLQLGTLNDIIHCHKLIPLQENIPPAGFGRRCPSHGNHGNCWFEEGSDEILLKSVPAPVTPTDPEDE